MGKNTDKLDAQRQYVVIGTLALLFGDPKGAKGAMSENLGDLTEGT